MTATDVTSAGFEIGQLRNSLSNFETWPKFNFGKPGNFETGPCNLAGSGFETGVAVRALITVPVKIILGGHNRSIEPGTGLYLNREQSIRTSRRALYGDTKRALPAVI